MNLNISATLVFGFSPNNKKNEKIVADCKEYLEQLFGQIGFSHFLTEAEHYDQSSLISQAAALTVQLSLKEIEFPTLYNLLKIAEASLSLFPKKFEVLNFRYTVS